MDERSDRPGAADDHVVLRLAGGRFGLPLAAVAEVGRPPLLTRVPGLPEWVAGLANWRGRVLAVVDLRPLLGATGPAGAPARCNRLVVLVHRGVQVGLLADTVDGTAHLVAAAAPPSVGLAASAAALLSGVVSDAGGPVALLDVDAVLALSDRLPRARRAG